MEFNQFKEKAFEAALKNGCDAAELYFVEGDSFSAMVLEQELDSYSVSRERGLNLRVQLAQERCLPHASRPVQNQDFRRFQQRKEPFFDNSDVHRCILSNTGKFVNRQTVLGVKMSSQVTETTSGR